MFRGYLFFAQDELEFRHKTLPISVNIDLHHGEMRTVEASKTVKSN